MLIITIAQQDAHYNEASQEARAIFGRYPDEYFQYWHRKFPHLFIRTWTAYKGLKPSKLQDMVDKELWGEFRGNNGI